MSTMTRPCRRQYSAGSVSACCRPSSSARRCKTAIFRLSCPNTSLSSAMSMRCICRRAICPARSGSSSTSWCPTSAPNLTGTGWLFELIFPQSLQAGNRQAPPVDLDQFDIAQFMKKAGEMLLSQVQPRSDNVFADTKIDGPGLLALIFTFQLLKQVADDALLAGAQRVSLDVHHQSISPLRQAAQHLAQCAMVALDPAENRRLGDVKQQSVGQGLRRYDMGFVEKHHSLAKTLPLLHHIDDFFGTARRNEGKLDLPENDDMKAGARIALVKDRLAALVS